MAYILSQYPKIHIIPPFTVPIQECNFLVEVNIMRKQYYLFNIGIPFMNSCKYLSNQRAYNKKNTTIQTRNRIIYNQHSTTGNTAITKTTFY